MKGRRPGRWRQADMYELFPQLERRARTPAQALSGGEQQMLSLCRTLMGEPALIVIDEPTEGLAPLLVEQVAAFLLTLKRQGVSVLLIEQRLDIALQISDRVYVLGHGKVAFAGTPQDLRDDETLRRTWIAL
jgi:branched-chain amino acid transport system ATP-binding protein